MKVTITRRYCTDTRFDKIGDCPLIRALNRQHPDLKITRAMDGFCESKEQVYEFDCNIYSREAVRKLIAGEINEIVLELKEVWKQKTK